MLEILFAAVLGSLTGIAAGFIPGIGISTVVMSLYLVLLSFNIQQILIFYVCLLSSAQYFGSIPAIFLGVAGEASSFPAVIEGNALMKKGQGLRAIFLTGIGSLIGGIVGLIFLLIVGYIAGNSLALSTGQLLLLLLIVGMAVCLTTKNKWWVNLLLVISAIILAHIGSGNGDSIPYINFGIWWLADGVSYVALAAAMISVKEISFTKFTIENTSALIQEKVLMPFKDTTKHLWSMIRGSLIGAVGGLVPGITTIASSHFAYAIEKVVQKNKYSKGDLSTITSSESANNSGAITSLLPLLVFGVPITFSEAILYGILTSKNWNFGATLPIQLFLEFWYIFVIVNAVSLYAAIKLAPKLIKLFPSRPLYLSIFIFILLTVVVYITATLNGGSGFFDVITFFVAVLLVAATPNVNYLPLIFWLVIGESVIETFYRYIKILGLLV